MPHPFRADQVMTADFDLDGLWPRNHGALRPTGGPAPTSPSRPPRRCDR
jgi:hypothetical protein